MDDTRQQAPVPASTPTPTAEPKSKADKADADKERRRLEKERKLALNKAARAGVDADGLQQVAVEEPKSLSEDERLAQDEEAMDVDSHASVREEIGHHKARDTGSRSARAQDDVPTKTKKKRRGAARERDPATNEDALLDDWRARLGDVSISQATLDAEATAAKAAPSTKKKGKGNKKGSAVREDGLHDSDVEAPKPTGSTFQASKISSVALAQSTPVPEAKPRARREPATPAEKSKSAASSLPPELLEDDVFEKRIVPALCEDVGSRHGVQVWHIKSGLAPLLTELCQRYVPQKSWDIVAEPSDKIYKLAERRLEYWRKGSLKSIKRMVDRTMKQIPSTDARKAYVSAALAYGGAALYALPDKKKPQGLFQSPYMLKGLSKHLQAIEGSERKRDRPIGALCLVYVQVLTAFNAWATGVDDKKALEWTDKKVTGLLESAWPSNFRRYTRHPEEFDVIAAAAVRYQLEQGGPSKHKPKPSGVVKYITRLVPASSEPEGADEDGSDEDDSDEDEKSSGSSE
ncbi:hypothetical protein PENSPDRAFT_658207 [Peniophora sp. CONT]|nr:hypothetical protein PENSPDRAFT_658207 [Peniophora sp. CONT]